MVLGFKPRFKEPILNRTKKFSIRRGSRWEAGMKLHMATGTRTKNYDQFNKGIPDLSKCIRTQKIDILFNSHHDREDIKLEIKVDGKPLEWPQIELLANYDGFKDATEFREYWLKEKPLINGQIIHWTDFYF